ncbi:MAG TPA: aldo/keto reductase [Burkholderiales bacterium]|nr:aldo/keto reductase [Burkholderiales bacterium]
MDLDRKSLGRSGIGLSILGFGGTGLGNMYVAMPEHRSMEILSAAYAAGMRYFDTAPLYGHGLSELRTGAGLRSFDDPRVVLSSKVGWRLKPAFGASTDAGLFRDVTAFARYHDYSYDGAMRSFEDSLQRLGTDRIDVLMIHDVDRRNQGERFDEVFAQAMAGAYKAILSLREQGVVKAIGCGLNDWEACQAFAETGDFDCFLLAGRYTLLEQESLETFLPLCEKRSIGVILGGPYNSGILASGAKPDAWFNYAPATAGVLAKVAAIEKICADHRVPLKAAALQFPLHHRCVASVIPGISNRAELDENLRMLHTAIPDALWRDLKSAGLMDARAPTP